MGYMSSASNEPSSSVPSVSHAAPRNMPEPIMSDSHGDQNSAVHDQDAAGTYTDDDSDYDEEEGEEGDGEENEAYDDSDDCTIVDDTPCPPPRTKIVKTHPPMPGLRLPSPALEQQEPSGGFPEPPHTASETWSPSSQVADESRPAKRAKQEDVPSESTAVRIEVFNPVSRSWSPLANQRGFTISSTTKPRQGYNENNVIVIDDDSESDYDENHDEDGDLPMAEAPPVLGTHVPGHRGHHLEKRGESESEDQFVRERAHITHILRMHGILR
ncbi:hypothetical protein VTN02DRAFT_3617 [Thermoascus thermophilus]